MIVQYNRDNAMEYANKWALGRNPRYFDYSSLGGDCTNFISQCIYAGSGVMNYTKTYGWYYNNANDKAPAWTGVTYLYNFLTRNTQTPGPFAKDADIKELEEGDIIQLSFQDFGSYNHSLFIVKCGEPPSIDNILINTHTYDRKAYPLNRYSWNRIRFLKILGVITRL